MLLFLFLYYWLLPVNSCSKFALILILLQKFCKNFAQVQYCTNFNPIAELVIPIGIPIKEAKAEIEIYQVVLEAKIRKSSV